MPEPETESAARLSLCVLTIDVTAGVSFIQTVCGLGGSSDMLLDGVPVHLELCTYEAGREPEVIARLSEADAVALLVHHIDAPAMDLLKNAYRIVPGEHKLPTSLLIVREAGRMEFKMGCPACCQKLWVRDEDQGRVGRCPHCKKNFVLPAQAVLIKQHLMLPASLPVVTVMVGNPGACRGPLASLVERARLRAQALKSSTMPIPVEPDVVPPGV